MYILPRIYGLVSEELKQILAGNYHEEIILDLKKYMLEEYNITQKSYNISLVAKNFEGENINYEINIGTENLGNIFKIAATNQRYKTTSLLIISILLGYFLSEDRNVSSLNFEDKREILSNDRLIQRFESLKEVIFTKNLDKKENKKIFLQIKDIENKIILKIEIDDEKIVIQHGIHSKTINIYNTTTYDEYTRYINNLKLFNVHLVSKGRNFVKYVLVEETKKYIQSLELIKDRLKSKQVVWLESSFYNKDELKRQIDALKYIDKIREKRPIILDYYKKTIEIERLEKSLSLLNGEIPRHIEDIDREIEIYKSESKNNKIDLEELLGAVIEKLDLNIYGNYNDKMDQLKKFFENEVMDKIEINIPPSNKLIVPFTIHVQWDIVGGAKDAFLIKNINDFAEVVRKLNVIQGKYYDSYNEFEKNQEKIEKLLKLTVENDFKLNMLEEERLRSVEYYLYKDKYSSLIREISEISSVDKPNDSQLALLSKRIKEAKISVTETDIKKLIQNLEQKMETEVYDTSSLYNFVSELTDAYEIFGREVILMSKGIVSQRLPILIQKNSFLKKLIDIFSLDIKERCGYFYRSSSMMGAKAYKIEKFDFWERAFYSEEGELLDLQNGLSGGTDSVMTVYSLASSVSNFTLGNVLLVDEWGDVSSSFNNALIEKLQDLKVFAFAIFVDVDDNQDLIKMSVEGVN